MSPSLHTLIIGGGAAGLTAACFCTGKTVVLERLSTPGRKLLATGGGRCNLTHATDADGIAAVFGRQARFMLPALQAFPPDRLCAFFRSLGVPSAADADGCVFPASQKASDVTDALVRAARANGADIRCGVRATRLTLDTGTDGEPRNLVAVETSQGTLHARRVILAAGGQSYPELGSDGSGFTLAREAGLTLVPPVPALAGLRTAETWPHALAGIVCEQGGLRLDVKGAPKQLLTGPVLFTHKGLSGPPALALAGEIAARLRQALTTEPAASDAGMNEGGNKRNTGMLECWNTGRGTRISRSQTHHSTLPIFHHSSEAFGKPADCQPPTAPTIPIRVSFIADRTAADWLALFDGWRRAHGGRALHNLLAGELPRALAAALCTVAGAGETAAARAGKAMLHALAEACAELPLNIAGTEGWHRAMVTRGGVALGELDPKTLACRRIRGLSCAGEIVDLDGPCGGYNLTWAFASGRLAATAQP